MAIWNSANALVTKGGAKILSQIQAGIGKLTISRIVTGGGYVPPARLYDQTAVSDVRQETKLVNIATDENGSAIEVQVDNSELAESYSLYQLGVYVTHESVEGEVLYWIAQCDENSADVIPLPSELPVALNYSIYVEHSNAGEITISVNPEGSVSLTTFNAFKEEINNKVQGVSDDLSEHKTDVDAHSDYKGATTESAGVRGFVPASPVLESEKDEKFLRSDGTWAEAGKVKTVNGEGPDENGDVKITTGDTFQKDIGIWEAKETVGIGDIRFPYGRQHAGKVIQYIKEGTTGEELPSMDVDSTVGIIFPRYEDLNLIPLGLAIPNPHNYIPDGFVAGIGQLSTRSTYPVWSYMEQRHPDQIIPEEEWQQMYTEQDGFVPFYSSGDGSTTFRFPSYRHYFCATEDSQKIGKYESAGLPNITGEFYGDDGKIAHEKGALYQTSINASGIHIETISGASYNMIGFDASRSNNIYGDSDTVRPKTMYGMWIIKAYGVIPTADEMTAQGIVEGVKKVETNQTELENKLSSILTKSVQGKTKPTLKLLAGKLDTSSALLRDINFSESWRNFDMIIIVSKSAVVNGYTSIDWMWVWEIELAIESALATGTDTVRRWSFPVRFAGFWYDFYGNNVTDTYWQLAGQDSALPKAVYGAKWDVGSEV